MWKVGLEAAIFSKDVYTTFVSSKWAIEFLLILDNIAKSLHCQF